MSSPRAAVSASVAAKAATQKAPRAAPTEQGLSAEAKRLAVQIERALTQGHADALTPEALQALTAATCKLYSAQIEAGQDILPLGQRSGVSATDVMTTASGLLRAVNLAVFELGMWQSWTGR